MWLVGNTGETAVLFFLGCCQQSLALAAFVQLQRKAGRTQPSHNGSISQFSGFPRLRPSGVPLVEAARHWVFCWSEWRAYARHTLGRKPIQSPPPPPIAVGPLVSALPLGLLLRLSALGSLLSGQGLLSFKGLPCAFSSRVHF